MYRHCIQQIAASLSSAYCRRTGMYATLMSLALLVGCNVTEPSVVTDWAVIDIQRILDQSAWVKQMNDQINTQLEPQRTAVKAQEQELQTISKKLTDPKTLQSQQTQLKNSLEQKRQQLFTDTMKLQEDTTRKEDEALRDIYVKLDQAIAQYNQDNHYSFILRKSYVLYASPQSDITPRIATLFENS